MSYILSQVSYPVFLYCVFMFFIFASIFSFIVGLGLAMRNDTMLRFFDFMNKGYSVRRLVKPLTMPYFIEPVMLKRPRLFGTGIIFGSVTSILLLGDVDPGVFQPMFLGPFSYFTAMILANYTKSFLLIGNDLCVVVGMLMLFSPHLLSRIRFYTDKWYTLRKQTRPLTRMHLEIDKWVLSHSTVFGVALSILSLGLCASVYARI